VDNLYEYDYAAARQRNHAREMEAAKAALPAWFHLWADVDADGPPPTPTHGEIRSRLDGFGFAPFPRTNAVRRSRLIDRIKHAIRRWT
jgi:hypothetical protein